MSSANPHRGGELTAVATTVARYSRPPDEFRYRLTRRDAGRTDAIEVDEMGMCRCRCATACGTN